jgi:hypothetical protein
MGRLPTQQQKQLQLALEPASVSGRCPISGVISSVGPLAFGTDDSPHSPAVCPAATSDGKRVPTGTVNSADICLEATGQSELELRDGEKNRDQQRLLRLARLQA